MMTHQRTHRLIPKGVPRYIRVYDNGDTPEATVDRYSVVYTGRYTGRPKHGFHDIRAMSGMPDHPQGFCQWCEGTDTLGGKWPPAVGRSNHLGKRIQFSDLPLRCQKAVLEDYRLLWDL